MPALPARRRIRRMRAAGAAAKRAVVEANGEITAATQILKSAVTWWLILELAIKLLPLLIELFKARGADNFGLAADVAIDKLVGAAAKDPEAVRPMAEAATAGNLDEAPVLRWMADRSEAFSGGFYSDPDPR